MDRTQYAQQYQFIDQLRHLGNFALCQCGMALKFNTDLSLSNLDSRDLIEIALQQPELYQQLAKIRQLSTNLHLKGVR